jgi:uncharacterized protein YbcI
LAGELNREDNSSGDGALAALGEQLSAIHEDLCGTVPDSVQCVVAGSVLTCVLNGGLTPIERTLIEHGQLGEAREYREAVIDAQSERFSSTVAGMLGREVASAVHVFDPDQAVTTLLYVLQPATSAADQRQAILAWATQVRSQAQQQRSRHANLRETQRRLAAEVEQTRSSVHAPEPSDGSDDSA